MHSRLDLAREWGKSTCLPRYISQLSKSISYANDRGIEVGGYDLIDLDRSFGPDWDAVMIGGGVEGSACFASSWVDHLYPLVDHKVVSANLTMIETDGPWSL